MKTHDLIFASRRRLITAEVITYGYLSLAYTPYGDYWRHLRKICHLELLSPKRIQSFVPIIEEEITNLIKFIASQEGSVINLTQASCSSLYTISSKAAFGNKCKDQEGYISAVDDLSRLLGGFFIADLFPSATWLQKLSGMKTKLEKLFEKVDRILENIISDHRVARSRTKEGLVEAREDLIDILLKFEDVTNDMDFRLTNTNIKAIIFDIFTASNETTTTTDWAMAEMLKDPRVLNKAQAEVREVFDKRGRVDEAGIGELKYLKSIIKETLRLHPPIAMLLPRECGQACEINGYQIPAKSTIIVNAWAIARDPNHWIEAERFYPERFIDSSTDYKGNNFEFIPFGAGRRICPGMNFGVANIEWALALLLYHFDWKLPNGMKNEDVDMTEEFGVTVSRRNELYLIPMASRPLLVDTAKRVSIHA